MTRGMIIRRSLPILLGLAGVSLLVYGAAFSQHEVFYEEKTVPEAPPPEPPPPPFIRPGPGGAPPPFIKSPPRPPQEAMIIVKPITEREAKLVLEATRGGVTLTKDGKLKRTYSGAPPSGCPT